MTNYQGDYSDDWEWWDNTEPVTITIKRANSSNPIPAGATTTNISISDAFRGDIDSKLTEYSGIDIASVDQIWSVPTALVGANRIEVGDILTDGDGVVWAIANATEVTIGTSSLYWTLATNKRATN